MIYLSLTFWLLVAVLTAWGIHKLWVGMVKPRAVNFALLPGTLIAQIGHVLGLLVTGATITDTALINDDDSAEPKTTPNPKPRIPVIGPVIIGLLPLVACGAGIFLVVRQLGQPIVSRIRISAVGPNLPTNLAGLWQMMRDQITLMESTAAAVSLSNFSDYRTWLFLYFMICLVVRIAPFPGNLRGAIGAIAVLGVGAAGVSSLFEWTDPRIQTGWSVLGVTIGALLILLLFSLLIRGTVGFVQLLRTNG